MTVFRRAIAMKTALNLFSREVSPYSSSGFRGIRVLGGVSIPRPPPSRPQVFSRAFSAIPTTSGVNDPSPNWSNRPPKETILLDGCDYEHWFIVMEPPEGNPSRDEIIDSYIKTLTTVLGSEEEARMKIYSVSTKHYYAFGCLISEELSNKLKPLPNVRWVLPDSYLDPRTKSYGGEPFINGQAVPYDPKYHEEWVRNNARCNERRSNDRHRNMDRSRNFERRREMRQNAYQRPPPSNTYQAPPPPPPPSNTYQAPPPPPPPSNTYQATPPPPNNTYQAPQGNTMQGAPDSQGRKAIEDDISKSAPGMSN